MPQVTVYVREDDLPKWKALDKKSEFIHAALNNTAPDVARRAVDFGEAIANHKAADTSRGSSGKVPEAIKVMAPRFCKNGHAIPYPKDRCLGKGCKYS